MSGVGIPVFIVVYFRGSGQQRASMVHSLFSFVILYNCSRFVVPKKNYILQ